MGQLRSGIAETMRCGRDPNSIIDLQEARSIRADHVFRWRPLPFRCPPAANLAGQGVRTWGTTFSAGLTLLVSAVQAANIAANRATAELPAALRRWCGPGCIRRRDRRFVAHSQDRLGNDRSADPLDVAISREALQDYREKITEPLSRLRSARISARITRVGRMMPTAGRGVPTWRTARRRSRPTMMRTGSCG